MEWRLLKPARRTLARHVRRISARPRIGQVQFGDLRRIAPICPEWGFGRGTPVDRYYIEDFLSRHANDIRGRVIELGTNQYTRRFGGGAVVSSDVLHVQTSEPPVTMVGDLTTGHGIPCSAFDCAIITQTLQFVYDVRGAVQTIERLLVPGGVALVTVPGITKVSPEDMAAWGQYWSFTSLSIRRLFEEAFGPEHVRVECAGNVLSAIAFLEGIAAEELTEPELRHVDPSFETLLGVRAHKPRH